MISLTQFIRQNLHLKPAEMALKASSEHPWTPTEAANLLKAYQVFKKKIPSWFEVDGLKVHSSQSLQQASSEPTAKYKAELIAKFGIQSGVDLCGGLGVDSYFMSQKAEQWYFVEQHPERAEDAKHNFRQLAAKQIEVVQMPAEIWLAQSEQVDLYYMDPDRRPDAYKRVFSLEESSPNPIELIKILPAESWKLIKSSPMLDVKDGFEKLGAITVHLLSVANELKELLWVIPPKSKYINQRLCVLKELTYPWQHQAFDLLHQNKSIVSLENLFEGRLGGYFYVPSVIQAKTNTVSQEANHYALKSVSSDQPLYYSEAPLNDKAPFRRFKIVKEVDFNHRYFRQEKITKAQILLRTAKLTEATVLKKLKINHGSDQFLLIFPDASSTMRVFLCHYEIPPS